MRGFADLGSPDRMKEAFYEGPIFRGKLESYHYAKAREMGCGFGPTTQGLIHGPSVEEETAGFF